MSAPDLQEAASTSRCSEARRKRKATLVGLDSARGVLQARIGRELSLRRTPHLTFAYDPSVEHGVRMTKLIDELAAELSEDDPDHDDD